MKNLSALALSLLVVSCGSSVNGASRTVLQNKGSDTLVNVAQAWAEAYAQVTTTTVIAVSGGGSGTTAKTSNGQMATLLFSAPDLKPTSNWTFKGLQFVGGGKGRRSGGASRPRRGRGR